MLLGPHSFISVYWTMQTMIWAQGAWVTTRILLTYSSRLTAGVLSDCSAKQDQCPQVNRMIKTIETIPTSQL